MESLSDTKWDVVISGTGLQQSLLALALSRSGKNILHVDDNDFYGGPEAAFSLQDVDEWVKKHQTEQGRLFGEAEVREQADALAFSRAYSLALAPTLVHSRSKLLSQLVDSKAFRQIEFLAVGSFYIYQPPSDSSAASLSRIPSTREDVFSNTSIPARSKRSLMKFLKFVLDYESETQRQTWEPHADEPLAEFLAKEFKLDSQLQSYVITLTLSIDGNISVKDGLNSISRHLGSMGVFGPGFAAVYPKWGGLSEVAQVGCRAAAVGGAVYMLGTGIQDVSQAEADSEQQDAKINITLANDTKVQAKVLVQGSEDREAEGNRISRLTAIVKSDLKHIFEAVAEGSPTPAVVVVAFPSGSISTDESPSAHPIYAMVHSSDTGECPRGQCAIYLSTVCSSGVAAQLETALTSFLSADQTGDEVPECLYKLYYEQGTSASTSVNVDSSIVTLPLPSLDLAFNDSILEPVHEAWKLVMADATGGDGVEYMKFEDREGANDYDDAYDYE